MEKREQQPIPFAYFKNKKGAVMAIYTIPQYEELKRIGYIQVDNSAWDSLGKQSSIKTPPVSQKVYR